MKKFFLVGLISAAVIIGAVALLYYATIGGTLKPIDLIPGNAMYILETDRPIEAWKKISGSRVWKHLRKQAYFNEITQTANSLGKLIEDNPKIFSMIGSRKVIASAHPYKADDYDFLYIIDLESAAGLKFIQDYLDALPLPGYRVSQRKYKQETIHEFYDVADKETLYMVFIDKMVVCSYKNSLLEAAINEEDESLFGDDSNFTDISEKLDEDGLFKFYLNYDYFDDFMRMYSSEENEYVKSLSKSLFYTGLEFDATEDEKALSFYGYTNLDDSVASFMKAMCESGRGKMASHSIIPQRTAFYMSLSFNDFSIFYENLEEAMKEDGKEWDTYASNIAMIQKLLSINVKENFVDWVGQEIAFVQTQPRGLGKSNEFAMLIRAENIDEARQNLDMISERVRRRTPVKFKTVDYKGYQINYMSVKGFFKLILGKLFSKLEKPYYTIIEDYVVFSNHPQTLKNIIDDYQSEQTLEHSAKFMDFFKGNFRVSSNIFIYTQTPVLYNTARGFVAPATMARLEKNREFVLCFPQMAIQMGSDGADFETRFVTAFTDDPAVTRQLPPPVIAASDSVGTEPVAIVLEDLDAKKYEEFYEDGSLKLEVGIKNGLRDGTYKEYYRNGKVKVKGAYKEDHEEGLWKYFDEKGKLTDKKKFEAGMEIK